MAPNLAAQAQLDTHLPKPGGPTDGNFCKVPTEIRAREAQDAILVQISDAQMHSDPDNGQEYQSASAVVLQQLKNGSRTALGSKIDIVTIAAGKRFATDEAYKVGEKYILLYREPKPNDVDETREISPCNALPDTASNLASIRRGINLDGSTGDIWDWYNEPGASWLWH